MSHSLRLALLRFTNRQYEPRTLRVAPNCRFASAHHEYQISDITFCSRFDFHLFKMLQKSISSWRQLCYINRGIESSASDFNLSSNIVCRNLNKRNEGFLECWIGFECLDHPQFHRCSNFPKRARQTLARDRGTEWYQGDWDASAAT